MTHLVSGPRPAWGFFALFFLCARFARTFSSESTRQTGSFPEKKAAGGGSPPRFKGVLPMPDVMKPAPGLRPVERRRRATTAGNPSPAAVSSYQVFTPYTKGTCLVASSPIAHKSFASRNRRKLEFAVPRCYSLIQRAFRSSSDWLARFLVVV